MSDDNVIDLAQRAGYKTVGFVDTPTSGRVIQVAEDCHNLGRVGIIRGAHGVGKTQALREHARRHGRGVVFVTLNSTTTTVGGTLGQIALAAHRIAPSQGELEHPQAWVRYRGFSIFLALERFFERLIEEARNPLLVIDEAQHCNAAALDVLRDFTDLGLCGLIVAGNPRLFDPRLGRMTEIDFAPLLSRAYHRLDLPAATQGDIDAILDAHEIKGRDARALMHECAARGAIRQIVFVIEKARTIAAGRTPSYQHLKSSLETTGPAAGVPARRGRSR